jgi:hypothetical protein
MSSQKPIAAMQLKDEVRQQYKKYESLRLLNRNLSIQLGISGIVFSVLATIVGLFGDLTLGTPAPNEQPPIVWLRDFTPWAPKVAAAAAAISAALQAALFSYPVGSRALFYSKVAAVLKNIELDLTYNSANLNEAAKLEELKEILIIAANEEPQGDPNLSPTSESSKSTEAIDDNNDSLEESSPSSEASPSDDKEQPFPSADTLDADS